MGWDGDDLAGKMEEIFERQQRRRTRVQIAARLRQKSAPRARHLNRCGSPVPAL